MKFTEQDLRDACTRNKSLARRNPEISGAPRPEPLRPGEPEPVKRRTLVRRIPREEKSGPRFDIVFTVYAVRPCDFDGWHIKPAIDMLVRAKIIPGDAWNQLQGSIRSRRVQTVEEERTEIEIAIERLT